MTGFGSRGRRQKEEIKTDLRQRKGHERSGKKVVIVVALGFWPDGRREILEWQLANSEDHREWEQLVKRLQERGVQAEQGLKMIVRDGCGGLGKALAKAYGKSLLDQRGRFHKLDTVADKVCRELKGKDHREARKQMMEQAALIYQAPQAPLARERLSDWREQWRPQAPEAVATLERDFEHTWVYYQLDNVAPEWIRPTSLLERTNRELRHNVRQALTFGSATGAKVAVFLHVQPLHACWTDVPWWQVSHDLYFALPDLHP